jgi:hypothetical protein
MDAIIAAHDGKAQMIDSTIVRVRQQAPPPVQLELSPAQPNDAPMAELLPNDPPRGAVVLADRAYDADWIREVIAGQECKGCTPPQGNGTEPTTYSNRT